MDILIMVAKILCISAFLFYIDYLGIGSSKL